MSALPDHPAERDRERFRDLTKAMQFGLEYDRLGIDGQYKQGMTESAFRVWWSVERERQLLQNLNQSQGVKISELLSRAEKAEAELAMLAKQEPVTFVIDFNGYAIDGKHTEIANALPTGMDLYAAPVPAVAAPAVLDVHKIEDQLLLAETEMLNAKAWAAGNQSRAHIGFAMTAISCARTLLQSAEVRHD